MTFRSVSNNRNLTDRIHKTTMFSGHNYHISILFHGVFAICLDLNKTTHTPFLIKRRRSKMWTILLCWLSEKKQIKRNFPDDLRISTPKLVLKPKPRFKDTKNRYLNQISHFTTCQLYCHLLPMRTYSILLPWLLAVSFIASSNKVLFTSNLTLNSPQILKCSWRETHPSSLLMPDLWFWSRQINIIHVVNAKPNDLRWQCQPH